jgi:hypothetical protein
MQQRLVIVLTLMLPCSVSLGQQTVPADQAEAPPKAARSVHLNWPATESVVFYNELTVVQSVNGSYFMACGFRHGYFGIQQQGNGRKVVIFSVWDQAQGNAANVVPAEQRVEGLFKADDVTARRFGGEGTGAQSFFEYDWKTGEKYRFFVSASAADGKTAYAAYFYLPETNSWKHLVTFRTRSDGDLLKGLYSFVEDFRRDGKSAQESRRASFGNGWVQDAAGAWHSLAKARFTASGAKWEAKDSIDAGLVGDHFYLQTGGDTKTTTPLASTLERTAEGLKPPELPAE